MTQNEFNNLQRGDLIRHKGEAHAVIVDANYGARITAIQTVDVTNPIEWELVAKAKYDFIGRKGNAGHEC